MAKRKFKKYLNNGPEEILLDSGVTIYVRPFPPGLYEKIQARALIDHPDPVPPKKEIEVVDGTEIIDNPDDETYQAEVTAIERKRNEILGEAVYDLCVDIQDAEKWEPMVKRLEKYQGPFPEDPDERKLEFLTSFALATAGDYERVMASAIGQTLIRDPEVSNRLQSFRGEMEGTADSDPNASGPDGNERLAVQSTLPRA